MTRHVGFRPPATPRSWATACAESTRAGGQARVAVFARGAPAARACRLSVTTTSHGKPRRRALCRGVGNRDGGAKTGLLYFADMVRQAQMQLLSSFENIEIADGMLQELCASSAVEEETAYWVGMALREALANAIKHGNKLNPEKRVHVLVRIDPGEELCIEVEDEGEGFNPADEVDPTSPENLLRDSGRGIFYIRHFMDTVRFSPGERGGTRVALVKRLNKRAQGGLDEERS